MEVGRASLPHQLAVSCSNSGLVLSSAQTCCCWRGRTAVSKPATPRSSSLTLLPAMLVQAGGANSLAEALIWFSADGYDCPHWQKYHQVCGQGGGRGRSSGEVRWALSLWKPFWKHHSEADCQGVTTALTVCSSSWAEDPWEQPCCGQNGLMVMCSLVLYHFFHVIFLL